MDLSRQRRYLTHATKHNMLPLLYDIAKLVAKNDTIGGKYDHQIQYTKKTFKTERRNIMKDDGDGIGKGGSYLGDVVLPIYQILTDKLHGKKINIKQLEHLNAKKVGGRHRIQLLDIAKKKRDVNMLYKITKVVAKNDSIREGWRYNKQYDKDNFKKEFRDVQGGQLKNYLGLVTLPIYRMILTLA